MPDKSFSPAATHDYSCEHAAQATCRCRCRGAGHQFDLVQRAATCSNSTDMAALASNLDQVFGEFRSNFRDARPRARGSRKALAEAEAKVLSLDVRKGATWLETVLVDEGLHAAFLMVANSSLAANDEERGRQRRLVDSITRDAIPVVGSLVEFSNIAESHVWCSIVAEYLASTSGATPRGPIPPTFFGRICYPRKSIPTAPSSLPKMRQAGLAHLASQIASTRSLSTHRSAQIVQLVGAATCPDLWRHPAAVRYCLEPFVSSSSWPPARSTKLAVPPAFSELGRRWSRKGNW